MANTQKQETAVRTRILDMVAKYLEQELDTDVMPVSASELTIPVLDDDGKEIFANVKVTIPRGTRNSDGGYDDYDGYACAEDWKEVVAEREERKAKVEKKKADAEAERQRRKAARKAIKTMKKEIQEVLPNQAE